MNQFSNAAKIIEDQQHQKSETVFINQPTTFIHISHINVIIITKNFYGVAYMAIHHNTRIAQTKERKISKQ